MPRSNPRLASQQTFPLLIESVTHNINSFTHMKMISHFGLAKCHGALRAAAFGCIGILGTSFVYTASAADATSDGDFNNSIEITAGGFSVNKSGLPAFAHNTQMGGASEFYGGLQSLHIEKDINKSLSFSLDGHSLADINDHDWKLALTHSKYGYVKAGYSEYETWYDGYGGFYPNATSNANSYAAAPSRSWIAPLNAIDSVDRGSVWIESGLRMENLPEVTFRAEHSWRRGEKDSTSWGDVTNALYSSGPTPASASYSVRKISPSFLQLDETRDTWSLDVTHTIAKTDVGLGLRFEHFASNDFRQENFNPENAPGTTSIGTTPAGTASTRHRYMTDQEGYSGDIFSAHAFTQTHLNDKLSFSTGYAYSESDMDIMGSHLYGSTYSSPAPYTGISSTFTNMAGENKFRDMVLNLNLNWTPIKDLSITPSIRAERQTINGWDQFVPTPPSVVITSVANKSVTKSLSEDIDIRYTGVPNTVLYAEAEWMQDDSRFFQQSKASNVANPTYYAYNDDLDNDKFTLGANWYPLSNLSVSAQAYHKDRFDNPSPQSILSGASQLNQNYSSYLLAQDTSTNGANIRVTWRPLNNLTMVTRYDWLVSKYSAVTYDGVAVDLNREDICDVTSQILSESITWNATDRLYIQGSVHASWGLTDVIGTVANSNTTTGNQILVDSQNNYWDGVISLGYQINDKTNVDASYTCSHASNPAANSPQYLAFGARDGMQALTIGFTRQCTPNLRWNVKAGYFQNRDATSGGFNDYDARVVSTSLQYRF
jgi:hypothetical protein